MTAESVLVLRSRNNGLYVAHFGWDGMWNFHIFDCGEVCVKPRHWTHWVSFTDKVSEALTFKNLESILGQCYCYSPEMIERYFKPAVAPINLEIVKVNLCVESVND